MPKQDHFVKGAVYLIIGEAMLVGMAAFIKEAKTELPELILVFYRNVFALLTLLPFLYFGNVQLKTQHFHLHLLRTCIGLVGMYGFFFVITHMPLAESSMVKLSVPVFLPIVAYLWLKEKINTNHVFAILLGFIGVAFILKPGSSAFQFIAIIGLIAAFFQAGAKVAIRRMKDSEPPLRVVFYFALLGSGITFFPATTVWEVPEGKVWLLLFCIGLFGTLGQICITKAYQAASPGRIGAFTYSTLVFSTFLGWYFWDERLGFLTSIGFGLIVLAGLINLYKKNKA